MIVILWKENTLPFLFILDEPLKKQHLFCYFPHILNREQLEFKLVQKLAIAIIEGDQAERLLLIHFVFLDWWYFVFLVVVEYVSFEVFLVLLQSGAVYSCVEGGGK